MIFFTNIGRWFEGLNRRKNCITFRSKKRENNCISSSHLRGLTVGVSSDTSESEKKISKHYSCDCIYQKKKTAAEFQSDDSVEPLLTAQDACPGNFLLVAALVSL